MSFELMKPSELAQNLRQIASKIDKVVAKGAPVSSGRVAADLKKIVSSISRTSSDGVAIAEEIANSPNPSYPSGASVTFNTADGSVSTECGSPEFMTMRDGAMYNDEMTISLMGQEYVLRHNGEEQASRPWHLVSPM